MGTKLIEVPMMGSQEGKDSVVIAMRISSSTLCMVLLIVLMSEF